MSQEFTVLYLVEEKIRRMQAEKRVRETTGQFLERYRNMLHDFERDNFDKYIPEEMDRLRRMLDEATGQLKKDPFAARDTSREIQSFIHSLRHLANENRRQQEIAAREAARRAEEERRAIKSALNTAYYAAVRQISGAAVQNFAAAGLKAVKEDIAAGRLTSASAMQTKIDAVIAAAEKEAAKWQKEAAEGAKKAGIKDELNEIKEHISAQDFDAEQKQEAIKSIDELLGRSQNAAAALNISEIKTSVAAVEQRVEEAIVSEDKRKAAVVACVKILRSQGFEITPDEIVLTEKDGQSVVQIITHKANGRRTEIAITDTGKMTCRFDNYEGKACIKEIEAMKSALEEIYSIKLSDERIIWENPDKIAQNAFDLPQSARRNV